MKNSYLDQDLETTLVTLSYFLNVSAEFLLDVPLNTVIKYFKTIEKLEEKYGIIGKKVDEEKLRQSQNHITLTPENAHLFADKLTSLSKTYESMKKQRKL